MLSNLPFDEAVVEPRIIVAEERIQNGGLAGVFSRLAGGACFRGLPGAGKRMLRKKVSEKNSYTKTKVTGKQ